MKNAVAIGYALMTLKEHYHMDEKELQEFEQSMRRMMDIRTEDEAELTYINN